MMTAIVSRADLQGSLLPADHIGRRPGESLRSFRARREIERLDAVNMRAAGQMDARTAKIMKLRKVVE